MRTNDAIYSLSESVSLTIDYRFLCEHIQKAFTVNVSVPMHYRWLKNFVCLYIKRKTMHTMCCRKYLLCVIIFTEIMFFILSICFYNSFSFFHLTNKIFKRYFKLLSSLKIIKFCSSLTIFL